MRVLLVLLIGFAVGLMSPEISEAHKGKHNDRDGSYSQRQDGPRGYAFGYQHYDQHRHQHKAWKKHRKEHRREHLKAKRHWRQHDHRRHQPARVVYRDRWPFPIFPGIVIHLPL